jgi:hypothetical protein
MAGAGSSPCPVTRRSATSSRRRWAFPITRHDVVLEGGAIDVDDVGTLLTTESCLFEPNRNPSLDRQGLRSAPARGLRRETRRLAPPRAPERSHRRARGHHRALRPRRPRGVHAGAARRRSQQRGHGRDRGRALGAARDATGTPFEIVRLPSPGVLRDEEGEVMPATYCNFYIANRAVIVPTNVARVEGHIRGRGVGGRARDPAPPSSSRGPTSAATEKETFFAWAQPFEGNETIARFARSRGARRGDPGVVLRARGPRLLQQRRDGRRRRRERARPLPQEPHPRRPGLRGEVLLPPRRHGLQGLDTTGTATRRRGHLLGPVVPRVRARDGAARGAELLLYPTAIGSEPNPSSTPATRGSAR